MRIPCITDASHWSDGFLEVPSPPPREWIVPRPIPLDESWKPLGDDDPMTPDALETDRYMLHVFGPPQQSGWPEVPRYWIYVHESIRPENLAQRAVAAACIVPVGDTWGLR